MSTWIVLILITITSAQAKVSDVEKACKRYKATNCNLVKAIAWVENRYRNKHVMDKDSLSYGPMQVKCAAARDVGLKYSCNQLRDKSTALRFGIKYLEQRLLQYNNIEDAVVAYNSYRPIVCKKYNPGKCYPGEYINQSYLIKVMRYYNYLERNSKWTYSRLPLPTKMEMNQFLKRSTSPCMTSLEILPISQQTMMSWKF